MKKIQTITILILQCLTMLIFISNHFIIQAISDRSAVWFFGLKMSNLIVDITLYIPIIMQLSIIILLAINELKEDEVKNE